MYDRDKVLHGLNSCGYCDGIPNVCGVTECPYESDSPWCTHYLAHDAGELIGELLKAQGPEAVDASKPDSDIGCWYDITHNYTLEQIVNALKAQEPRVMTLEELSECVTYWIEDENGHVIPETIMDISGKNIMTIPVVHLTNGYAPIITKTTDGYNSKRFTGWRCWTSRPTDEQRKAVKWND